MLGTSKLVALYAQSSARSAIRPTLVLGKQRVPPKTLGLGGERGYCIIRRWECVGAVPPLSPSASTPGLAAPFLRSHVDSRVFFLACIGMKPLYLNWSHTSDVYFPDQCNLGCVTVDFDQNSPKFFGFCFPPTICTPVFQVAVPLRILKCSVLFISYLFSNVAFLTRRQSLPPLPRRGSTNLPARRIPSFFELSHTCVDPFIWA